MIHYLPDSYKFVINYITFEMKTKAIMYFTTTFYFKFLSTVFSSVWEEGTH